ncbi:MAG: tRNA pseudouridine(13) synthase TruD [Aquificae bacterium]|nr:tRNA pseudouridine(13) synthase TruD [Aquificota bacterium]
METYRFDFPLKVSPFDFIVKEEATFPPGENYYRYLLIKRNLNTNDPFIVNFLKELGVREYGYAGLKDRHALTVQSVSLDRFVGRKLIKRELGRYFALLFVDRIARKIKVGHLKGNTFFVNHWGRLFYQLPYSLNYYDSQRLGKNVARGRRTLKEKPAKKWEKVFWINSYQSFVWNLTAFRLLERKIEEFNSKRGFPVLRPCRVEDGRVFHVFPCSKDRGALLDFLKSLEGIKVPLVGYKVRLDPEVKPVILQILQKGGITLEDFRRWGLKGDYRPLVVRVEKLKRYPRSLRFFLPKGAFATVYLKFLWLLEVS